MRKTQYDLISVEKAGRLINMDSQAPNAAAGEWLRSGGLGEITDLRPETVHGDSRFDFSFIKEGRQCFLEVKGCTLENDDPEDRRSPAQRLRWGKDEQRGAADVWRQPNGAERSLRGRCYPQPDPADRAAGEGYGAYVLFVIQMENVCSIHPNDDTDPDFGKALREAAKAGVTVLAMDCHVTEDSMTIRQAIPVIL